MINEVPQKRTEFVSDWDQCVHLLDTLAYWYWHGENPERCSTCARELDAVLDRVDPDHFTQRGAEARALICAVSLRWDECIVSKRRQIEVMRRLLSEGVSSSVVSLDDLVEAVEELLLLAREGGKFASTVALAEEVIADAGLNAEQRSLLGNILAK